METIDHYREQARHFRRLAQADSPVREQFAKLAHQYDLVANSLELIAPRQIGPMRDSGKKKRRQDAPAPMQAAS
jgi:hypothetical protein